MRLHWLSWLAEKMVENNAIPYLVEIMQPNWLGQKRERSFMVILGLGFLFTSFLAD